MVLALSTTFLPTAWVLAVVLLIGFAVYYWFNIRSARDELGAELLEEAACQRRVERAREAVHALGPARILDRRPRRSDQER